MRRMKMYREKNETFENVQGENENVQGEERKCAGRRKRRMKMCREKKEQERRMNMCREKNETFENVQGEERIKACTGRRKN